MADKCGGWSETKTATEDTQRICDQVKDQVEKKTGKNYEEYKAVKYRNWERVNFLIKVHVGGVDYIHLSVCQELEVFGAETKIIDLLRGVLQHMTKDSPLEPFTD